MSLELTNDILSPLFVSLHGLHGSRMGVLVRVINYYVFNMTQANGTIAVTLLSLSYCLYVPENLS